MTYNELDTLRNMSDPDAELAEELTAAVEQVLADHPFKRMPRSVRFLGAGFGCMEIFCRDGVFTVVRNNGAGLDCLFEVKGLKRAFCAVIELIYSGREGESFAEERYKELFVE